MKPYYKDNHNTIYCLDFRQNDLPDESIQCVVTSPPYWGLRKYSGEQELIWGIKTDTDGTHELCDHQWGSLIPHPMHKSGGHTSVSDISKGTQDTQDEVRHKGNLGCWCQLCGCWRGAYGLEPTPEMYIEHTIEILREIRRVLRKDGVVFWNIGDSYATSHAEVGTIDRETGWTSATAKIDMKERGRTSTRNHKVLKPKDLCLIPFRVAIAAQEDGWWIRSVIIWSKPNPMPESVTDRPTESHEYILMLTKSARYYFDQDSVREAQSPNTHSRGTELGGRASHPGPKSEIRGDSGIASWLQTEANQWTQRGRNIRSVWEFPTQPYPEAHFAVFPEKLPEICIKAATPEVGCCSKCGAPWERIVEKPTLEKHNTEARDLAVHGDGAHRTKHAKPTHTATSNTAYGEHDNAGRIAKLRQTARAEGHEYVNETRTVGWQPTCKCNADKVPSIVLDPFLGAGTTLWVAKKLNRQAVGYEISEEYCRLAVERCRQQILL